MSFSSDISKVAYPSIISTTQTLSVSFYFLENSHLKVIRTVNGVDTVLTIGTNYTVTGAGNNAGGSITLTGTGVAIGDKITIVRNVPLTQLVNYVYNDKFPAETHERALDKLTMIAQASKEQGSRCLRFGESETLDGTLNLADRKGKTIQFNASTGALELTNSADSAAAAAQASASASAASAASAAISATTASNSSALVNGGRGRVFKSWQKVQAIRRGTVAQLRFLIWGDSVAARQSNRILDLMRKRLGTAGYIGGGNIATTLAGGAATSDDFTTSPVGGVTSVPSGGSIQWDRSGGSFYSDTLQIYYVRESGAGTFKVQSSLDAAAFADETGYTSVSAANATKTLGVISISKAAGNYRLKVVGLSGTVRFLFPGFVATSLPGVVQINIDRGGVGLDSMNTVESTFAASFYSSLNPDIGWFEMKEGATFATDLATHVSRWESANPLMDWIYVATTPVVAGEAATQTQNEIMRAYVEPLGYMVTNSYADFGSFAELNAIPCEIPKTVSSITRVGTTATANCTGHVLTGIDGNSVGYVLISGADQPEYNGVFLATPSGANAFTFSVSGSATTPATGTITMAPTFGGDGTHLHSNAYDYAASQSISRIPLLQNVLTINMEDGAAGVGDPLAIRTPIGVARLALANGKNPLANLGVSASQGVQDNTSHWQVSTDDGTPTGKAMLLLRSWYGSGVQFNTWRIRSNGIGGGQYALSIGTNYSGAAAGFETIDDKFKIAYNATHIGTRTPTTSESGLHVRGDDVNTGRDSLTVYKGSDGTTKIFRVGNSGEDLTLGKNGTALKGLRHGTAVLVGGTVVVSDATITANSIIILTCQSSGGTPGFLRVSTRSAGTSFTILSSSGTDTSTVGYAIIEP